MKFLIILLLSIILKLLNIQCFIVQNIQQIAEYSRSNQNDQSINYQDNPHTIPFNDFVLDPSNPSFSLTGSLDISDKNQQMTNIFQIYKKDNQYSQLIMFYQDIVSNSFQVQQMIDQNTSVGIIRCNINVIGQSLFTLSMRKVGNNIDYYVKIINNNNQICEKKIQFTTTITDWSPSSYVAQFSNLSISLKNVSLNGSVYRVYLIKNIYLGDSNDNIKRFAQHLSPSSDSYLSYIYFFPPDSGKQICLPDQSINKQGCALSTTQLTYPSLKNINAEFRTGQFIQQEIDFYYKIYFQQKYNEQILFTLSFWIFIDSSVTDGQEGNVFSFRYPDNNKNKLNLKFRVNSTFFKLVIVNSNDLEFEVSQQFQLNQYYFCSISYYKEINNHFIDLIVDDQGIKHQELLLTGQSFIELPSILTLGDSSNSFSGLFIISQFNLYFGSSIIYDQAISNSIINNCSILFLRRMNYECLLCDQGFFLNLQSNSCESSCLNTIQSSEYRTCFNKCNYRCNTCDNSDPNICLDCSSNDRDISKNCQCKQGYEDFFTPDCQRQRKGDLIVDVLQQSAQLSSFNQEIEFKFKKIFNSSPKLIFSLVSFQNLECLNKSSFISDVQLSLSEVKIKIKGSYNLMSDQAPPSITNVKYMIFAYDQDSTSYFSRFITLYFTAPGVYESNVDIGNYDKNRYGDYKILTFLSGFQTSSTSQSENPRFQFNIEVSNDKKQIMITVNESIKVLQFCYLILPLDSPYFSQNESFNTGIFTDTKETFIDKTHVKQYTLHNPLLQVKEGLSYPFYFGVNQLDIQIKNDFNYIFAYYPREQPNKQKTFFNVLLQQLFSYTHNGIYFIDQQNTSDTCRTRNFYTNSCISCIDPLLNPEMECKTCVQNRIVQGQKCICPDPEFRKDYKDQIRCSYQDTAVLDIWLSIYFDKITIDFGLDIEVTGFRSLTFPSYELCVHALQTDTLNLIKPSSRCYLKGNFFYIKLGKILQFQIYDQRFHKNELKF